MRVYGVIRVGASWEKMRTRKVRPEEESEGGFKQQKQ